jgi:CBS domain-containing protein
VHIERLWNREGGSMRDAENDSGTVPEATALLDHVNNATSSHALADTAERVGRMMLAMHGKGRDAAAIAGAVSRVGRAVAERLLTLAEARMGSAPVAYAFVVAGSQARDEQVAGSDQDNGLILADDYSPDRHGAYFRNLAETLCNDLAQAGYRHCPGDIMATNPRWRLTLSQWQRQFSGWIERADPEALLRIGIFFDLRAVRDDAGLLPKLHDGVLEQTRDSTLFQARLAAVALGFRPAMGWLGRLRFRNDGKRRSMDLKRGAITPVVDLARVHALALGESAVSTRERLDKAEVAGLVSNSDARHLRAAFDQVSTLRIGHQCRRIRAGEFPDYRLRADELDGAQARRLKHALTTITRAQQAMARRYQAEAFL